MKRLIARIGTLRIMATAILLAAGAVTYAQTASLTIQVKETPVKEILKMIEAQSQYRFFYSDDLTYINRKITLNAVNKTITALMNEVLRNSNLTYKIDENNLIILVPVATQAQPAPKGNTGSSIVRGVVTDVTGEPLPGTSVVLKGTKVAVLADIDGKYTISVPDEGAVLSYVMFGFTTQDVQVGSRREIDVTLKDEIRRLDEVVVVGYGTQNKKTMTGSVSVVDKDDLITSSKSTVSQALQGKAAGLRVQQKSAQAGGGVDFKIRGAASPKAGNEPLFVIDGIPIAQQAQVWSNTNYSEGPTDNYLESLNPDDIESITVLKDAASTAIYGARAGHGVILITTKRGSKDKSLITYSGNVTVQNVAKNYEMLNSQQYMEVQNKYKYELWLRSSQVDVPGIINIYRGYGITGDGSRTFPGYDFNQQKIDEATTTDWIGAVMRTAILHQHNVSMSGGTESLRYLVSSNYMNQEGLIKNNSATRFTVRANLDKDINKYATIGITSSYARNAYENSQVDDSRETEGLLRSAAMFNPTLPIRQPDGSYTIDQGRATVANPVSLLEIEDVTSKDRIAGSVYLLIKPLAGLELKAQLGADLLTQKRSNYVPTSTYEGLGTRGEANIVDFYTINYLMTLTASYTKNFGEHHLKAMAGYEYLKDSFDYSSSTGQGFSRELFSYHRLGEGLVHSAESGGWGGSLGSYFGRLSYDYASKYLLELSIRADGASNFTPENRWGYFPSVATGWMISEEPFMESTKDWLANLKLRVSYGETGNYNVGDRTADYYEAMLWTGYAASFGDTLHKGVETKGIGNPDITWETTSEMNIGIDVGFLKNRISLTAEYFDRTIRDLLDELPIMYHYSVSSIFGNIGKTQSQGFELTINTVNFDKKDFNWNTTATLSHYRDRWKERSPYWRPRGYESVNDYLRPEFNYVAVGLMQPGDNPPAHQSSLLPGGVILVDQNKDRELTEDDDKVLLGTKDPAVVFGFNNALRYKSFDFSIYFYGEAGAIRGGSYKENLDGVDRTRNMSVYALDKFAHDNLTATRPSMLASGLSTGNFDTRKLYFIRCGNIRLGYTIPIPKKIVSKLQAYVSVDNVFVLTNWTGLDPETDSDYTFSYPNVRAYTLGINISL